MPDPSDGNNWNNDLGGLPLYDSLLASVKLRYRFLPRIYSIAHETYASNMSFVRPLAAEFPEDRRTWD